MSHDKDLLDLTQTDDEEVVAVPDSRPAVGHRKPKRSNAMAAAEIEELERPKKVAKGQGKKSRNWCFTQYRNPQLWYNEMKENDMHEHNNYLVFQLEKCPTTGRMHVQGYAEFTVPKTQRGMQDALLLHNCHVQAARGSSAQNKTYCTKEESRWPGTVPCERGAPKEQGKRTDLDAVAALIRSGADIYRVVDEHPVQFLRYGRNVQQLVNLTNRPRMRNKPSVFYLWGPPGCGKSRLAHHLAEQLGGGQVPHVAADQKECWFDGYSGQKVVIFDDFAGNFNARNMYQLLDRYLLQLPVKGGFVPIAADTFIFTSNIDPQHLYMGHDHPAWRRRLTYIWDGDKVIEECKKVWPDFEPEQLE